MPPILGAPQSRFATNAEIDTGTLGSDLGGAVAAQRNRAQLEEIAAAAQGGNFAAARDAAFKAGRPEVGLQFQQAEFQKQSRQLQQEAAALRREEIGFNRNIKETELGIKLATLELEKRKAQGLGGFKDKKELATVTGGIRKEVAARSGDFIKIRDSIGRVRVSGDDAAGDISMIFNFMKMLDPGSVVRESEFATAQNAAGVPDRIRNTFNRLKAGERLSPDQRDRFRDQAESLFKDQLGRQQKVVQEFTGLAERLEIDPRDILVDLDPNAVRDTDAGKVKTTPGGNTFRQR